MSDPKGALKPNLWNKWFGSWQTILINQDGLVIVGKKFTTDLSFADFDSFPSISISLFSIKIDITLVNGTNYLITGVSRRYLNADLKQLKVNYLPFFKNRLLKNIEELNEKIYERFLRDSWISALDKKIEWVLRNYKQDMSIIESSIDNETKSFIEGLMPLHPISNNKETIRSQFEDYELRANRSFFSNVEKNELTQDQSLAVIRDNDFNLIVAAAGTGKTSVMVAKAIYLVKSGLARSDEILLLAYNNSAAKELDSRIKERARVLGIEQKQQGMADEYSLIKSSTFHALGLKILKDCNEDSFVSVLATDEKKRERFIQSHLEDFILSNPSTLKSFISLQYIATNPFDFESIAEYERFLRDNEYRGLSGDLLKGYQEVLICNYLWSNQIKFTYEHKYVSSDGSIPRFEEGVNYKPDFFLTDYGIYIEHFGIDRNGNVRVGIDKKKYNEEIALKRKTHKEHGTILVETFHYEWIEGMLLSGLDEKLKDHHVRLDPIPREELFDTVKELGMVSKFSTIMRQSIDAVNAEQLDESQIIERLKTIKHFDVNGFFLFLSYLLEQYSDELKEKGEIDFDGMIHGATMLIESGEYPVNWKYILVDEFQDISTLRFNFVKSLITSSSGSSLCVVGDDWQSIYRFAGGKLELITRFTEFFGQHSVTNLGTSFRYNDSIADVASTFIMKNPEQRKKEINTLVPTSSPQVYLLVEATNVQNIIDLIRKNDIHASISILSRYNYILDEMKEELAKYQQNNGIVYWTFHRAKGLETDYSILLGFKQGRSGFPNENKNDQAVEALLPLVDGFPHSEERRLMYVALTRAKKKTYLLADPLAPSAFIDELIFQDYGVLIHSILFEDKYRSIFKCSKCTDGYLIRKPSKYRNSYFYSCNTYPGCHLIIQECDRCQAPMEDNDLRRKCKNPDCLKEIPVCPRCYKPLKRRSSRYGPFWGCSGYAAKPPNQCTYKRNIRDGELPNIEPEGPIQSILDYGKKMLKGIERRH